MYRKYQQFIAALLLFSILLQSCGNPNCQMVAPVSPNADGQTGNPSSHAPLTKQEDSEIATAFNNAPTVRAAEGLAEASKAAYAPSRTSGGAAHERGRLSTPYPTADKAAQAPKLASRSKKPLMHRPRKPQRSVPDRASMPQDNLQQTEPVGNTLLATSVGPTERKTHRPHSLQRVARLSSTEAKLSTEHAVHQAPPRATLPIAVMQSYPSAQGHQVRFQAEAGKWQAQVEDIWGREQRLPVVCARDQTPARAIEQLTSKALGQHKYWVHLLETNQPPWAPRCVYVGVLGLRGGGRSSYSDGVFHGHMEGTAAMREIDRRSAARSRARMRDVDFTMATSHPDPVERMVASNRLFSGHRAEREERNRSSEEFSRQADRSSEEFSRMCERERVRKEQEQEREVWEREQEQEREVWEREQEQRRHAQEEKDDYEAFCRGEAPTPPESPRRSSNAPNDVAALSKQAYFSWKEQEEIRIAKEAKERAKQFYFSRWQQQEPSRRAEARKQKLDEAYRREERRRQEAPRREQEERRARLDETYRREEQRRKREEVAQEAEVMSAAACAQGEEDDNVEEVYTDYRAMPSDASASAAAHENAEEDRKMPATPAAASAQGAPSKVQETASTPWRGVPFTQQEVPEQGLGDLFHRKLYKPSSSASHANTSASPAPASAAQEDRKRPSLPAKTKIDSLETAQAAVEAYQASLQHAIPEERKAMQERGQEILKGVETLKKTTKQSYRHQALGFETQDVDPLVWDRVLQDQKATQAQLHAVRFLRTQLLDASQVRGAELKKGRIRTPPSNDQEAELYSSDEDEQQLSSEAMRDRQESLKEVVEVTKEVAEMILESGPALGAGVAVKVAGKIPKVLKATKAAGQAVQGVAKAGKSVTSVIKKVDLPSSGKIRFIPRPSDVQSGKLLRQNNGYVDKFGNLWRKPKVSNPQGTLHWDVQLSKTGRHQLGHLSPSGAHLNVTKQGTIHH